MLFAELLLTAFRSLAANRLRTALTMLGMVIGVGAVVTMISLGEGARASVETQIKAMGTNLLTIRGGANTRGPVHGGARDTLKNEDATALVAVPGVTAVAPEVSGNAQVKYFSANTSTSVVGSTPAYFTARNFKLANGTLFTDADVAARRRVAVLGSEVATTLFGGLDPVGERIQVKGLSFTVAGVLESKGDAGFFNPDEQIVIPYTTHQSVVSGRDYLSTITVQAQDGYDGATLQADIERLLRARHRLTDSAESDFNIRTQAEMLQTMDQVTGAFTALLGGVAAVSLLVGGIGIMNIMLVSVRERTREIGIRKAVGARQGDILVQFLVEAVVVSVAGGVLGIGFGYALAAGVAQFAGWATVVPLYAIEISTVTSIAIGIVFGVWPARVAAKLDPVEALRYE